MTVYNASDLSDAVINIAASVLLGESGPSSAHLIAMTKSPSAAQALKAHASKDIHNAPSSMHSGHAAGVDMSDLS